MSTLNDGILCVNQVNLINLMFIVSVTGVNMAKKIKNRQINKKMMLNFANHIYNTKTKKFTNLCVGKLQSDEFDKKTKRPVCCALGEFYCEITGRFPKEDKIDDTDAVIDMIIDRAESSVHEIEEKTLDNFRKIVDKSTLMSNTKSVLNRTIEECKQPELDDFADLIREIPEINDDMFEGCDYKSRQNRARVVAQAFRRAANELPF